MSDQSKLFRKVSNIIHVNIRRCKTFLCIARTRTRYFNKANDDITLFIYSNQYHIYVILAWLSMLDQTMQTRSIS